MVGRLVSFWGNFLAGAMLVSGSLDVSKISFFCLKSSSPRIPVAKFQHWGFKIFSREIFEKHAVNRRPHVHQKLLKVSLKDGVCPFGN